MEKNVLAQAPDLNDFVAGLKIMMRPGAIMTIEFPHLLATMEGNQFDQSYHEHYCYFSLLAARPISPSRHHALDAEEVPMHGGSLRISGVTPRKRRNRVCRPSVRGAGAGRRAGPDETYAAFAERSVRPSAGRWVT